jgi:hypothetical protein
MTGGVGSDLAADGAGALANMVVPGSSAIVKPIVKKVVAPVVGATMMGDDAENDDTRVEGDYANSPDEEYSPASDVIKSGNDLNKSKKSYPKVAGGDNPRALADKIKEELSALYTEYKGQDVVKEGVKDMIQDVEEGMGKAKFEKEYPGQDYDKIKQEIKDKAKENN